MERLDTALLVKSTKRLEFKQTLYDLSENLQKYCTKLEITESDNSLSYSILAQWKTEVEMFEALKEDEFKILSGAIKALCEKSTIRLNDKLVGNNISILADINKTKLKTTKS